MIFYDQFGNQYQRGDRLGAGGQGAAYRVVDEPQLAIKMQVLEGTDIAVESDSTEYFADLTLLPLPIDLPLARPIAALMGVRGYVMQLVVGLQPVQTVLSPSSGTIVAHSALAEQRGQWDPTTWSWICSYGQSMSTRQRLLVASSIASTIARLHSLGFVYKDISPGNCFVPRDPSETCGWLIDCDNLGPPGRGSVVYTPTYGAPEVASGGQFHSYASDAFSLATLTYQLVTGIHPFDGPMRRQGGLDWDDEDSDDGSSGPSGDELWMASQLPFVEARNDVRNRRPILLSSALGVGLANVFESLLGAGRENPLARSSASLLASGLARAAYLCCTCPVCKIGFHAETSRSEEECPVCGSPFGTRWAVWLKEGDRSEERLVFISEPDLDSFEIPLSAISHPRMRSLSAAWIRVSRRRTRGMAHLETSDPARKVRVLIDGRWREPSAVVELPLDLLAKGLHMSDPEIPGVSLRLGQLGDA